VQVSSWFFGTIVARAALCTALTITPAFAGRPLQTEDASVLARGECEVEGSTARLSAADAAERSEALQLGCGIGVSTQLALAVALLLILTIPEISLEADTSEKSKPLMTASEG
jgi:hypothetical protein